MDHPAECLRSSRALVLHATPAAEMIGNEHLHPEPLCGGFRPGLICGFVDV